MVYQPHTLTAVWGAEFALALEAIGAICGCEIHWRLHGVHRPNEILSQKVKASNAALLVTVVVSPH